MGYKRHLIDMLVNSVVVADETNGDQKIIIAYNLSQEASEYRLLDLVNVKERFELDGIRFWLNTYDFSIVCLSN